VAQPETHAGERRLTKARKEIEELVKKHSFTPLSGLIGEPLVNVFELNLDLDAKWPLPASGRTM